MARKPSKPASTVQEHLLRPEEFRVILDHMADLIAVIDANGKRLYNSPSYRAVLDEDHALVGTDSFAEIHPEDRAQLKRTFEEAMRTGVGHRAGYRFVRRDGSIRYIESQSDVIKDAEGRPQKMVVVSRDITERKKAEEKIRQAYRDLKEAQAQIVQSEKLATIGQFAAAIVHDLKNPLGVIKVGIDLISHMVESGTVDQKVFAESTRLMDESVNRASKMVHGLLDLSRREDLKLTRQSFNPVIEHVVDLVKAGQPLERITISKHLMADAPLVMLDGDKMEQVLVNLVSNAIQAMPKGGEVRLTTSTMRLAEGAPRVGRRATDFFKPQEEVFVVEIADTGTGIPEESLKKIFEPFFTTKPRGEGTGLGLAIVRSMIEGHRGVIEATSQPGQGTTFRITLPIPFDAAEA